MIVVDASVAVKWFLAEPLHAEARRVLDLEEVLVAPDLLAVEVANVAWKKTRRGELTGAEAKRLVAALLSGTPQLRSSAALAPAAFDLAVRLDHAVYDCVYLALALSEQSTLLTADTQFHNHVAASDLAGASASLATWTPD